MRLDAVVGIGVQRIRPPPVTIAPLNCALIPAGLDNIVFPDDVGRRLHLERRRLIGELRRIEQHGRVIAAEMDRVVPRTATNGDLEVLVAAEDIHFVGAAGGVEFQPLDARVVHDPTRTRDRLVGDHEHVGNGRTVDHQRVRSQAAVDLDGGILEVVVAVAARAAEQRCQVRHLVRVVGVLPQDQERVDHERIVVVAAVQIESRLVVVDLELVVLTPTEDEHRRRVAVGHAAHVHDGNAAGILDVLVVSVGHLGHGADDDRVVALPHVDDGQDRVVVGDEAVVAGQTADGQLLHGAVADVLAIGIVQCDVQATGQAAAVAGHLALVARGVECHHPGVTLAALSGHGDVGTGVKGV